MVPNPAGRIERSTGVFLGLYGAEWIDNAIQSVERQECGPLEVVAAVNGPETHVLRRLEDWQHRSRHDVTIVTNGKNLGPLGSWYVNRDLLCSPWVAILHQDDVYGANHIASLNAAAELSPVDVLAIFTSMSAIDEMGRALAAPPLDNAYLDLAPTSVTLPSIVRRHPLPTPASLIRNPAGFVDGLAWYDSGAPDSEWFATLACRGRFRVLPEITMQYRLSARSESASTGWHSRAWQWAQSLDRLINSQDFVSALVNTPSAERADFSRELLAAVPARYPDSPIFGFLQFAAAQRMSQAWDYEDRAAIEVIATYLEADPGSSAARNLRSIAGYESAITDKSAEHVIAALLGDEPTRGGAERAGRAAYRRFGHLLPPSARLKAYRLYDRIWHRRGVR